MDTLKQFLYQLQDIWKRWSVMQRSVIVAVGILSVLGISALTMWASQQDFVPLASQLNPSDAHEIVSMLQAEGVEYELNFSGSTISVPSQDLAKARLAIKETGAVVSSDYGEDEDAGFGSNFDPTVQKSRQQRNQERRLAMSVQRLTAVKAATVHITPGESSPFIRDATPAKASVILDLQPGASFTGSDAEAVVSLVSHSVENLSPEDTTIIDTNGRVLSSGESFGGGDVGGQLDFKRRLEMGLASKAEAMLNPVLGHGLAIVRVTADVDFTETNTARTSFDPDGKAKTKELITTESTTGGIGQSGSAGVTSNVGSPDAISSNKGGSTESETIETEFQNSETIDTIREAPGKLTRLTIAAVVQLPEAELDEEGNPVPAATPPVTKTEIEAIIKQAVGFDPARNDEIEVLATKMAEAPNFAAPLGWATYARDLAPLASSAALILASVIALMLGMKTIKRLKPVVVEVERSETIDPEVRAQLAEFSEEILSHPEALSTVLNQWMDANAAEKQNQSKRKVA